MLESNWHRHCHCLASKRPSGCWAFTSTLWIEKPLTMHDIRCIKLVGWLAAKLKLPMSTSACKLLLYCLGKGGLYVGWPVWHIRAIEWKPSSSITCIHFLIFQIKGDREAICNKNKILATLCNQASYEKLKLVKKWSFSRTGISTRLLLSRLDVSFMKLA